MKFSISHYSFELSEPYEVGGILTRAEAQALNQPGAKVVVDPATATKLATLLKFKAPTRKLYVVDPRSPVTVKVLFVAS